MFSTNSPAISVTSRGALDRALTLVVEESFFAMIDPVPENLPAVEGQIVSASVSFEGSFSGAVTCRMPRALAHELTAAFIGEEVPSDGEVVDDLAGEFANMVCGRWLTRTQGQVFDLEHPTVEAVPDGQCAGWSRYAANGVPLAIELAVEGR